MQHKQVHKGTAKKYVCSLCGKALSLTIALHRHEKIHDKNLRRKKNQIENLEHLVLIYINHIFLVYFLATFLVTSPSPHLPGQCWNMFGINWSFTQGRACYVLYFIFN